MTSELLLRSFRDAAATMLAAVATLACALALDPEPGPAILAVVLCLSLSRSQLDRDLRGRLEAAVMLPVVSLAALGVGALLLHARWVGALVFVTGMSVSIWLRRFGPMVRRAGSLIALPFVVILTTPYVPTTRLSPLMAVLVPAVVALLALFWVTVFHWLAGRMSTHAEPTTAMVAAPVGAASAAMPGQAENTGIAAEAAPTKAASVERGTGPAATTSLRPIASTRMAIQMAIALAFSFVVGYSFFPERWAWIVLTAYIVGSANQGRLDVAYKSVLRVIGAAAGTVVAMTVTLHAGTHDAMTVALILIAVFLGLCLRPFGYAWWALFVTLALSLLQGFEGTSTQDILWPRLEEIVIGAIIGVAAAWFVLPVRSTDVLRRRIADALARLSEALDPATRTGDAEAFRDALLRVEQVAPAFRAGRFIGSRLQANQPADWIDALLACRTRAVALIENGESSGDVRKALGAARKAMREPDQIGQALSTLRASLR